MIEDSLDTLNTLGQEAQSQQRATAAAELSLRIATNRYQAGSVDYLNVASAQTIALENQRNGETIEARRLNASVRLLKALGGGWDRTALRDTAPAAQ